MAIAVPLVIPAAEAAWAAIVAVGSVVAASVGIGALKDSIDSKASAKAPSATSPCEPPDCKDLNQNITETRDEIKQRYDEMRRDEKGLYEIRPAKLPGVGSWDGHVQQYENKQANLRRSLKKAVSLGCKQYPSDSWQWATDEPPIKPAP